MIVVGLSASAAQATAVLCCTASSDFGELEDPTNPNQLQALFGFAVTDPILGDDLFTLTLSVENQTPVSGIDASFNINTILFNGILDVLSVTLVSVIDEGAGSVTAAWGGVGLVLPKAENIGGFDDYRFSLFEGTGLNNPSVIQPGETSVFVFAIAAPTGQTIDMASFNVAFINPQGAETGDFVVAAKFVSCTGDDCVSPDDSAFGGGSSTVVPEPASASLLSLGLAFVAFARRRRRR